MVQGLFREHLPEEADQESLSFVRDSKEILSLPRKDDEYKSAFLNPRMKSALVCPIYQFLCFQGILYLNSLYENHYRSSHISVLEEHCFIPRLRYLDLQEALL